MRQTPIQPDIAGLIAQLREMGWLRDRRDGSVRIVTKPLLVAACADGVPARLYAAGVAARASGLLGELGMWRTAAVMEFSLHGLAKAGIARSEIEEQMARASRALAAWVIRTNVAAGDQSYVACYVRRNAEQVLDITVS